ncbi:MAG: exodeoxyribonuclease VII small subunit [Deltaproteobacteria bacterium]|nr:MAG: exodeoxyribonuclease VII small subunit [Deltaproteobacteria bacterium]
MESVVAALEGGELDLEDAMEAFKKGVALSKECHKRLDEAERKVKILRRELSGELAEEDFDADE